VIVRGKMLGHLFTLHPGTSKAFDIEQDLAIFDLQFNWLVEHGRNLQEFRSLAKFPAMNFDISVLVDKKAKAKDVERAITRADKDKLVKSIRIFDIYEGKSLPDDQKSITFKIEIRHDERTLTDAEFQKIQSAIFLALEKIGGKIRGKQTQLD
jgi:phenylalanyl-tRNA synthetase beta chain